MANMYELEARNVPAILCSLPFIATGFYFIGAIDLSFWQSLFAISIGGTAISVALFKLFNFLCRMFGKVLEEKVFKNGLDFPTTRFLLDRNKELSTERKEAIITRIKSEFGIDLRGKTKDTEHNRRRIHEAIGHIRKRHFKDNGVLLQRNIYFGFSKNMAGGSIAATTASMVCFILSITTNSISARDISVLLLIVYGLATPVFISAMKFTSRHYALSLFDEFMA